MSAMIAFVAIMLICQPIQYSWDKSLTGTCASLQIVTGVSYLVSTLAIITDLACCIVPCVVVWNLQMKRRVKISVCVVLALGMCASAATVARFLHLKYYSTPTDYLCESVETN